MLPKVTPFKSLAPPIDIYSDLQPMPLGRRRDVPSRRSLIDDKPLLGEGPKLPPDVGIALHSNHFAAARYDAT